MSKRWALGACLLVLGLVVVGCASVTVPGYSDAKALQKGEQFEQAIAKYNEFTQMTPESDLVPYAHYNIAQCYLGLRDQAKATDELNNIVKTYADSPIVQAKPDQNPVKWAQDDLQMLNDHPELMMPPMPAAETPAEQPATEAAPAAPAPAQ